MDIAVPYPCFYLSELSSQYSETIPVNILPVPISLKLYFSVMNLILVIFIPICLPSIIAYKVLVYNPRFAFAHVQYMGNLADILVDAGFDVVGLVFHSPTGKL